MKLKRKNNRTLETFILQKIASVAEMLAKYENEEIELQTNDASLQIATSYTALTSSR